jgi:hypothetical protein
MIRLDLFSKFTRLDEHANHAMDVNQVIPAMMIDKSTHEQSTDNAFNAIPHSISLHESVNLQKSTKPAQLPAMLDLSKSNPI